MSLEIIIFAFYLYDLHMSLRIRKRKRDFTLGIAGKLRVAIGVIIGILFITSVISILEYERMSTHVSDLISDNITSINLSAEFGVKADEYNLRLLSTVGNADNLKHLDFNPDDYLARTGSLLEALTSQRYFNTDSLSMAYQAYVDSSRQLDSIITSDFVDTREWYFTNLQPQYNEFRRHLDNFNLDVYENLKENSVSFDDSFYRSIMPSIISVFTAIVLCLLLLFFILAYYVRPLKRMLQGLDLYKHSNHNYNVVFEGTDELARLNQDISEIVEDHQTMRKRLHNRES